MCFVSNFCFVLCCALGKWRRATIALITTLPVPDCLTPAAQVSAGQIPPSTNKEKGHCQKFGHFSTASPISLLAPHSTHCLSRNISAICTAVSCSSTIQQSSEQEIHRKMTAQSCPRRFLVVTETLSTSVPGLL